MNQTLFREEAVNHQREKLWGDVILTLPLPMKLVTIVITSMLVALITYLILGSYTRKETVNGYLVPESGLVQVHPIQSGSVEALQIQSGDQVNKGDLLMRIKTDRSMSNGHQLNATLLNLLEQQKALLQESINRKQTNKVLRRSHLESRIANSKAQVTQLEDQKKLQHERLSLARKRYQSLSELRQEQLISESDFQNRYKGFLDERQRQEQLEQSLIKQQATLESDQFELASLESATAEELDQLKTKLAVLEQKTVSYEGKRSYSITAPIAGRVTSLQTTIGKSVNSRQPVLAILPEEDVLQAELFVPSRAIGFVEDGLGVEMRFDAFPYERFGVYRGQIDHVARTILSPNEISGPLRVQEPVYRSKAILEKQEVLAYGKNFPLQSGMTFEADILLEKRPLYQWILKPLYSLKGTL